MTLREQLAIVICASPEYAPPYIGDVGMRIMMTRCICQRDNRIPSMEIARCANCLSRADHVIEYLRNHDPVLLNEPIQA